LGFFKRSAVVSVLLTLLASGVAAAHPLGNFTINHLSIITPDANNLSVRYVLDIAEIPSFQISRTIAPDGRLTPAQLEAWGHSEAATLLPQLELSFGSTRAPLVLDRVTQASRPGAGGLPTLYLTIDSHAPLPHGTPALSYRDGTFAGRLGWKDVVTRAADDSTHELTRYPAASLTSPKDVTGVDIAFGSGAPAVHPIDGAASNAGGPAIPAMRSNNLSDLLARGAGDPLVVLTTLLVAIALGALHALEPGHGKTLLAVTLVGARATVKQAGILAASLTFAHTAAVLALGVAINLLKGYFVPEDVYPWITLVSGAAIALIGARALQRQLHERAHVAAHDHSHAHAHAHPHSHASTMDDEAHARLHAIPGNAPLNFGSTVWAAMSGGIAPCPAALVVLLAAIALNQVAYGIVVIVAFSFGLAATLTGLGILVVRGASVLSRRAGFATVVKYGPLASASIMAIIGCIMFGKGFVERGLDATPYPAAALAAVAVLAYAFGHGFTHRHSAEAVS
jgi:ABC-type nickel/cobalt efflux system permease component RcnA